MTDLASAIASAGGVPSAFAKNDDIGKTVTGRVESAELRQVTTFGTEELETWADGSPKQQVVVTLTTDLAEGPDDDGRRRVYIKWWGDQRKQLIAAIAASGDKDLTPGGTFTATFSGLGDAPKPGFSQPKQFTYQYVKPASGLAQAVTAAQPAPAAPVQQEVWGPPAPAAPAVSADLEQKIASMRAMNLGDAQIAAALGIDVALVAETPF